MMRDVDLLVVGAGPAGMTAAATAAEHGIETVLLDEQDQPGGQFFRPIPATFDADALCRSNPDYAAGEALRARLAASGVEMLPGRKVWSAEPGFRVDAVGGAGLEKWRARQVILACGTTERMVPFPGWTLPGTIGLAGATILLKAHQMLPGRRTVVAGAGPLLLAVAVGILKAGGQVAAVVDLARPLDWLRALPGFASRPDLLRRGAGWVATLKRHGVPVLSGHAVTSAEGDDCVRLVTVHPVDGSGRVRRDRPARRFEVDALAVGNGLTPSVDLSRLLRADHEFRPEIGGWVPLRDAAMRTSVPGLFVAGDCAGVAGAEPAQLRGVVAALGALADAGRPVDRGQLAKIQSRLARQERFGMTSARLMTFPQGLVETLVPETPVCRCEDVTRAEIDSALAAGASDLNQLKSWTRCGMGPCQGRMCGETVATLAALGKGGRQAVGAWTVRQPIRPIPVFAVDQEESGK